MEDFEKTLWDVYEGRMTFDQLVCRERKHFRSLAANIMRRWQLPAWVALEDVEQDLLFAAWHKLWDYEPNRGISITRYLVYNAYDKAKKAAHKARGAIRHGNKVDSNPSRAERGVGVIWGDDADRRSEEITAQPAMQEQRVDRAQTLEAYARSSVDRFVLRMGEQRGYLAEVLAGDEAALAECARVLVDDARMRELCGVSETSNAIEEVVKATIGIKQRMTESAERAA
jgi:DNA-directed RNA polymerase specialized sigma24 family protein